MFWAQGWLMLWAHRSVSSWVECIFVRPFRSYLAGLNLVLGEIGIVFGLALSDTIKTYKENPAQLGIVYDAIVTRQQVSDNLTQRRLMKAPGVDAFYGELQVKAWTLDERTFKVRAVDGELDQFPFQIQEGRFFQPGTNEAIAGKGLLTWLGLEVGDTITLRFEEKDGPAATWVIVGIYPEPGDAGQRLMVDLSRLNRLVKNNDPTTYYLKLNPTADIPGIRSYLAPRKDSDISLVTVGESIPDSVIYLQIAIFALSGILIVIALVNVLIMSLLAAQEKTRTVGILKTVGMTPAQVVAMFNTTAASLGALAVFIGIPMGLFVTKDLLIMSDLFGFGKISVSLTHQAVILIPFIVIVVFEVIFRHAGLPICLSSRSCARIRSLIGLQFLGQGCLIVAVNSKTKQHFHHKQQGYNQEIFWNVYCQNNDGNPDAQEHPACKYLELTALERIDHKRNCH
jgi:ABC-type lipoprotein release transport system permease subunit